MTRLALLLALILSDSAPRPAHVIPAVVKGDDEPDRGRTGPPILPTTLPDAHRSVRGAWATPPGVSVSGARAWLALQLSARQYGCMDRLIERESGWRVDATNRRSGAYGLPQALPGSKMARYGADWRTNPITQLRWMLAYIASRYGTPCEALAVARSRGWY